MNGHRVVRRARQAQGVTPASRTYFVEVSDNGNSQTGAYTLLCQLVVAATAVPLVPDVPAAETINPLGDLDLFTFTLATTTRVMLQ